MQITSEEVLIQPEDYYCVEQAAGVCCGVFFRRHVQEKIGWLEHGCGTISFAYIYYQLQVI